MRRRSLIVPVALVVIAAIAVPALSDVTQSGRAAAAKVTVKPPVGRTHTTFSVTFMTPSHAGPAGGLSTTYAVMTSGRPQRGCASRAMATIASPLQGHRLNFSLDPPGAGGWCPGTFRARIQEYRRPVCGPLRLCPQFIVFVGTVARFSFRVERG